MQKAPERVRDGVPGGLRRTLSSLKLGNGILQTVPAGSQPVFNYSYEEGYNQITRLLTKKTYDSKEMSFTVFCGVIAALASFYNFSFGRQYVRDIAINWHFSPTGADIFSTFCGLTGLVINTAINGNSLHKAFYAIRDEIITGDLGAQQRMPDDNWIRGVVAGMALLSIIGAAPNLKFVADTMVDSNFIYFLFMECIQFVTQSSLNFRPLLSLKLGSIKKRVVVKFKQEMLEAVNACLPEAQQISPAGLVALSQGILIQKRFTELRTLFKVVLALYVGIYSSAFYFAVRSAFNNPNGTGIGNDLWNFAISFCGLLSAGLKWFFLGTAYINLIDRIFNLFQDPILKVNENEVRSQYISRKADIILTILGLVVAVFSLGSASKIVEKYYIQNFLAALFLGGGAAWGINASDLSTLIERNYDFWRYIYKNKISSSQDPMEHLGNSHPEVIMRTMLEIAIMPDATFLRKFTQEFDDRDVDPEHVREELSKHGSRVDLAALNVNSSIPPSVYANGFLTNGFFRSFKEGCRRVGNSASEFVFQTYKDFRANEERLARVEELGEDAELIPRV